jgi:hypothetical protein
MMMLRRGRAPRRMLTLLLLLDKEGMVDDQRTLVVDREVHLETVANIDCPSCL